ncbi:hypothetical protein [Streptomyces sp. RFCAC02]|uniref:hypothetical protein n=1 Tax=Streptomyces sp. RFCAC02 TaxID=2499143 RepID=UPI001021A4FF|nr:hypothetical protein [Streptomyces sp. RFCAC02]
MPRIPASLSDVLALADADPAVLGVILSGSRAHEGMPTDRSDDDVHIVVGDGRPSVFDGLDGHRSARLDLVVMTLDAFRTRGLPGDPAAWSRYAYARAAVLRDASGGTVTRLLDRKRALTAEEGRTAARGWLDAYTNQTYRSLKSHRDGRPDAAHLDAAEAVPYLLETVFALHLRVRPYNKYLRWELERHPLGAGVWSAGSLLPRLERVVASGDAGEQRSLFGDVERAARAAGHGDVLDAWGDDLALLRG